MVFHYLFYVMKNLVHVKTISNQQLFYIFHETDMIDWVTSNYQRMDISMQPFVVRGGNTPLMKEIRPMSERNKVYSYMHYIFTKLVMLYLLLLLLLLVRFHSTYMLSKLVTLLHPILEWNYPEIRIQS